jgi:rhomboid protease GluP
VSERRDDDLRELYERMQREFGERQGEQAPPAPPQAPAPVRQIQSPSPARLSLARGRPRAIYAILAINVVMYGLTLLLTQVVRTQGLTSVDGYNIGDPFSAALYILGAKFGPAIDAGQYWRFLAPVVLHGGLVHLLVNSFSLYSLGPDAERLFGIWRFLLIYVLAGLAGSIASYIILWQTLSIGASGAIFGLVGALAAYFYSARALIGPEASGQQVRQMIAMAAVNIVIGFTVPAIDNAAHLGGFAAGAIAGFVLAPRYRVDDRTYPPVLQRTDPSAMAWLGGALLLLGLLAVAAFAVMLKRS